jgi:hypothetical protein
VARAQRTNALAKATVPKQFGSAFQERVVGGGMCFGVPSKIETGLSKDRGKIFRDGTLPANYFQPSIFRFLIAEWLVASLMSNTHRSSEEGSV